MSNYLRFNPRLPGGRRHVRSVTSLQVSGFNPRLPGGRRPYCIVSSPKRPDVSIHAFRGEGDLWFEYVLTNQSGVSIHAFRGEGDQISGSRDLVLTGFQSTPSGGKATVRRVTASGRPGVSIHAFRGEGDLANSCIAGYSKSFNPRLPGGRRRQYQVYARKGGQFQSTPSGGKATPVLLPC